MCIVTGASSGIGKATATGLARLGATVVLACRSLERGEATREEIRSRTGSHEVEVMRVDLASLASVHAFAAGFRERFPTLHVLVNNAGIYSPRRLLTADGLEMTFQVNHLSHFLLTGLLLDRLRDGAPSRIINVTSAAHFRGIMAFDDLSLSRRYGGLRAYAQSKLANILFTHELARRLQGAGVTANCVHPGLVRTNWARHGAGLVRLFVTLATPFMRSPVQGAETVLHLATAPEMETVTGAYFVDKLPVQSSANSYSEADGQRLWDVSEQLLRSR